jgi:hypothetical protein
MDIKPIDKDLADKLKSEGVDRATLNFQGGDDSGYLTVDLEFAEEADKSYDYDLARQVEDWAWTVYRYNGAGDGTDYGDDVVYDFKANTVHHDGWISVKEYTHGIRMCSTCSTEVEPTSRTETGYICLECSKQ